MSTPNRSQLRLTVITTVMMSGMTMNGCQNNSLKKMNSVSQVCDSKAGKLRSNKAIIGG